MPDSPNALTVSFTRKRLSYFLVALLCLSAFSAGYILQSPTNAQVNGAVSKAEAQRLQTQINELREALDTTQSNLKLVLDYLEDRDENQLGVSSRDTSTETEEEESDSSESTESEPEVAAKPQIYVAPNPVPTLLPSPEEAQREVRRNQSVSVFAHPTPEPTVRIAPSVAENGSYYGEVSEATGRPKTVHVQGYFRKDGTYVRGHYRSPPRR